MGDDIPDKSVFLTRIISILSPLFLGVMPVSFDRPFEVEHTTHPHCSCNEGVIHSLVIDSVVIRYLIIQITTDDAIEMHVFLGNRGSELTTIAVVPFQMSHGVDVGTFRHRGVVRKSWIIFDT